MRHRRRTKRLGRTWSERRALVKGLVTSLLSRQAIQTTLPKAKAAQRLADRVISLGKEDSLAARRLVFSFLQDHNLTSRLFREVAPRFKTRNGGYTRILHLERRHGDGAQMALLELTEKEVIAKAEPKAKAKAAPEKPGARHEGHTEEKPKAAEKETRATQPKAESKRPEPPKKGFFQNLSRFFRNKGGG